jgi:acyl dehydratase
VTKFFEDIAIGAATELGSYTFTADEIVAFARRYDPQYFHLDAEAAKNGPFGRLAASGWHTASVWMKLNVAHRQAGQRQLEAEGGVAPAPGPSPGFKNLRWRLPVFAGETLWFAHQVTSKRTTSNPDWGLVFSDCTGKKRDGTLAFSFEGCVMWRRRPAD